MEVIYLGVPPVRVDILRSDDGVDDVDASLLAPFARVLAIS
jgi:hypothetical protein